MNIIVAQRYPRLTRTVVGWSQGLDRLGYQTAFFAQTLIGGGEAVIRYRNETLRLIARMGLGSGALAIIGGAVGIVGFLTLSAGSLIGIQGYNALSGIGLEALTGFLSAYFNGRVIVPTATAFGLAATIGAGATAELGAMRINEEIDALDVMGIRAITYLASTRVIAGLAVVLPLYFVALVMSFFAAKFASTTIYGQAPGIYDHYFRTFLNPVDIIISIVQAIVMGLIVMLIHTYFGFIAVGGPAGVGEAVGRAVRASLVTVVFVTLLLALAMYGRTGHLNFAD